MPVQPPLAEQAVAPVDDQVRVDDCPSVIEVLLEAKVTVGAAAGGGEDPAALLPPPPPPHAVS